MKKLVILLALFSSSAMADIPNLSKPRITKGDMDGAIVLSMDRHQGYTCGILVDKRGHIRHFVTSKPVTDLTSHEVEPLSPDIIKDVFNSRWLDAHYWPKCPILTNGIVNK